ncbi:DUF6596 domain-containing protein [Streptomyces sp. NPDC088748]|uniref:DUF6596 domain-containing protein n=1 Tax=Streptomyces sp. NPDC088748 TaxID=3365887 RepID=UPI00382818F7
MLIVIREKDRYKLPLASGALAALVYPRKNDTVAQSAFGISTDHAQVHSVSAIMAHRTPCPATALKTGDARHVPLDGTLAECDRVGDNRVDSSGKHRRHGVNLQVITAPDRPTSDLASARYGRPRPQAHRGTPTPHSRNLRPTRHPVLADHAYQGAETWGPFLTGEARERPGCSDDTRGRPAVPGQQADYCPAHRAGRAQSSTPPSPATSGQHGASSTAVGGSGRSLSAVHRGIRGHRRIHANPPGAGLRGHPPTRILHRLLPDEAEATALQALLLLTDARRPACTTANGQLIMLQDRTLRDQQ